MRVSQELVEIFMRRINDVVNEKPTCISSEEGDRRARFIQEEAQEYADANAGGDLVEVADAIGDLAYVVLGAAVSHGIDLQPIFEEIHRSNMTKTPEIADIRKTIDGVTQSEKRCVKGANYQAPRLAELLIIQSTSLEYVPGL